MMSVTPRNEKYNQEYESPLSSGGGGSLRSNKLARRARSFKEDFLGRINQMRSPSNTINRSQSPHQQQTMEEGGAAVTSPPQQNGASYNNNFKRGLVNPGFSLIGSSTSMSREVERLLRELSFALRHFRDVVTKNTLVMLPGNGTVLLDTVAAIQSALVGNEPVISTYGSGGSTGALAAACGAVRHALSGLIELCDEVLLRGESALDGRDVHRDVTALEDAIQNLVQLAQEKMLQQQQQNANNRISKHNALGMSPGSNRTSLESQRTSLPDIPLTPREREILQRTSSNSSPVAAAIAAVVTSSPKAAVTPRRSADVSKSPRAAVRGARSTESLLRVDIDDGGGGIPPPKPPLPNRGCGLAIASVASAAAVESLLLLQQDQTPPPLPPKKKQQQKVANSSMVNEDHDSMHYMNSALDRVSLSSPEDCASILSGSGSLDSALNQSREEEELAALMRSDSPIDVNVIGSDVDRCHSGVDRFHPADDVCHTDGCHSGDNCHVAGDGRCHGNDRCHENGASRESDISEAHANEDSGNNCWDETNLNASVPIDSHRHSNESGFASMQSLRSSCQSFTKRSSQQSYTGYTSTNGVNQNHSTKTISDNMVHTSTSSSTSSSFFTKETSFNSTLQSSEHEVMQNLSGLNISKNLGNLNSVDTSFANLSSMPCNMAAFSNVVSLNNIESYNKSSSVVTRRTEQLTSDKKVSVSHSVINSTNDKLSTNIDVCDNVNTSIDDNRPPMLPEKTLKMRQKRERHHSTYDNLLDEDEYQINEKVTNIMSLSEGGFERSTEGLASLDPSEPPPLPLKKKHIMAYMEMFGNCSRPGGTGLSMASCSTSSACSAQYIIGGGAGEFTRHSVHACAAQAEWSSGGGYVTTRQGHHMAHSATMSLSPYRHSQPPSSRHISTLPTEIEINTCSSPKICSVSPQNTATLAPSSPRISIPETPNTLTSSSSVTPPALPPKRRSKANSSCSVEAIPVSPSAKQQQQQEEVERSIYGQEQRYSDASEMPESDRDSVFIRNSDCDLIPEDLCQTQQILVPQEPIVNPLDELDVSNWILLKKEDEEGPDIRGGHPDALIVLATKAKNELLYQEAFLTTYRTFITPQALVQKLCYRHQRLVCQPDTARQRAAKESFSMLVRIVSELTPGDLDSTLEHLREFCYQLISSGHLTMAKVLRSKLIEKYELKQNLQIPYATLSSQNVFTSQASLTDFKSEHLAEQMTLLDAELYTKIEIPEVLLWAREQCEERSPNLTRFTEHFNKMSYWARSRILDKPEARDRERYVVKFLKIMKHLRKMNNFNSYLALLSALDSAPITRLEWPKQTTEMLKEFCALIDSRSSFRAYRQALAESQPPCIPYIGLVLQDLTFIHIGNSDLLPDGGINFTKRWQQFHIVNNMRRFKTGSYSFKKNERIIAYFSNFDDYLNEEAMWQISESIKPRGGRKNVQ